MRAIGAASLLAVVTGVVLIALAIATGAATVALVLVIPVVYGHSPLLAGGVGLVILGLVLGMLSAGHFPEDEGRPTTAVPDPSAAHRSGGVILLGPVPIVWGSGTTLSRRTRWALAAVGGTLLVLALAVLVLAVR